MKKIVKIGDREVEFKTSGAFALRYKAQFHKDPISDIFSLMDLMELGEIEIGDDKKPTKEQLEILRKFDTEVLYNLTWALAKNADKSIPGPIEWLDEFEEFPIFDILIEISELLTLSMSSSIKSKKKIIHPATM